MDSVSIATAAQLLLARVAFNVGEDLGAMLDMLAHELSQSVPVYGLDGRTGTYRLIEEYEMRCALFADGAAFLRTADGGVFTRMTIRWGDFERYLARLDPMDASSSSAAAATGRSPARR